jgi:predicted unusual protein kinase regulating ubiquinone biosynthesis (AarF/ABC1/UbiB family)
MLAAQSSPVSGVVFAVAVLATSMALVAGLAWASGTRSHSSPWCWESRAAGLARGFAASMREELDFRVEARNTAAVAVSRPGQQQAGQRGVPVVFPAVYEQVCTEHVLVIEWLDGVSLRVLFTIFRSR